LEHNTNIYSLQVILWRVELAQGIFAFRYPRSNVGD